MNLRRGRADRRGAFRLASFMVLVLVSGWVVDRHVSQGGLEQQRFFARAGLALFVGFAMYLIYLGLEPFVRRLWPSMLVTSTRVLGGRLRDPLIGRDALIGVAAGAIGALLTVLPFLTTPLTGKPMPVPLQTDLAPLLGLRGVAAALLQAVNSGMQSTLIDVFIYSTLRAIFEWVTRTPIGKGRWTIAGKIRMSAAASDYVFVAIALAFAALDSSATGPALDRTLVAARAVALALLTLLVLLRLGIFAAAVMSLTSVLLQRMPMTFASGSLYAAGSWIALALVLGTAVAGFVLATSRGRSLLAPHGIAARAQARG
jgi:serine/threonine-protein kinase